MRGRAQVTMQRLMIAVTETSCAAQRRNAIAQATIGCMMVVGKVVSERADRAIS